MRTKFSVSRKSIRLTGKAIAGAEDRQRRIAGFDQGVYSSRKVLCVGAGGLGGFIAPTLVRKGIGELCLADPDIVEVSNLNRQFFYERDIGRNKAVALVRNLLPLCTAATILEGIPLEFEDAIQRRALDSFHAVICGVDNNPARTAVSFLARQNNIPAIFAAVSADGDHGYVFAQEASGPCLGCLFPDAVNDERYPCPGTPAIADILQVVAERLGISKCPGTPAIADILQAVGSLATYALDSLFMARQRTWNYRRVKLSDGMFDCSTRILVREDCPLACGS
ncbi:MAG: ThiF family adenylyltransferase [Bryobacteraceae bacterium]|nr:ThiF family adenylyltransferase [Bryobacteraceae bacterium]